MVVRTNETLVMAKDLTKVYKTGKVETAALRGVDLDVQAGEFTAVVGPSGSGKTTLLNLIGALDSATSGDLTVLGRDVNALSKRARADMRLHELGFVFQAYNLVSVLTAQENVEFVLELQGVGDERRKRAREVLEQLGLAKLAGRRPGELSGGEQQRVAVARCLAQEPEIFLLDEPTASLDWKAKTDILELVKRVHDARKLTTLFVTHDLSALPIACERVVLMKDGIIFDEGSPADLLNDDKLAQLYDMPVAEVVKRRGEAALI